LLFRTLFAIITAYIGSPSTVPENAPKTLSGWTFLLLDAEAPNMMLNWRARPDVLTCAYKRIALRRGRSWRFRGTTLRQTANLSRLVGIFMGTLLATRKLNSTSPARILRDDHSDISPSGA
jgi:hypothetical protein